MKVTSLNEIRDRKRFLSPAEAEALLCRPLSRIEATQHFTIEDLEKRMAETYECPVCLQP